MRTLIEGYLKLNGREYVLVDRSLWTKIEEAIEDLALYEALLESVQERPAGENYAAEVLKELEENEAAYKRNKVELEAKYPGQFAVFCKGKLVAVGPNRKEALLQALRSNPGARPYVRKIGEEIPEIPEGRP